MTNLMSLGIEAAGEHFRLYSVMGRISEKDFGDRETMAEYYLAKVRYNLMPFVDRDNLLISSRKGLKAFEFLKENFADILGERTMENISSYAVELSD